MTRAEEPSFRPVPAECERWAGKRARSGWPCLLARSGPGLPGVGAVPWDVAGGAGAGSGPGGHVQHLSVAATPRCLRENPRRFTVVVGQPSDGRGGPSVDIRRLEHVSDRRVPATARHQRCRAIASRNPSGVLTFAVDATEAHSTAGRSPV